MRRRILKINEELCNGCGKCVVPCVEGAITIVNGKAKVLREELCDGLGYCVGICPSGALTVEERETVDFNQKLAEEAKSNRQMVAVCFKCGRTEKEITLFPVRFKGRSEWVCARCIPSLIHG